MASNETVKSIHVSFHIQYMEEYLMLLGDFLTPHHHSGDMGRRAPLGPLGHHEIRQGTLPTTVTVLRVVQSRRLLLLHCLKERRLAQKAHGDVQNFPDLRLPS